MTEKPAEPSDDQAETLDPLREIQDLLVQVEPTSLLSGVVVIAEWVDEDGDPSLGLIASPMSPWHMSSLFDYVKDTYCHTLPSVVATYVSAEEPVEDDFGDQD